jgi:hypothetical protein
MTATRTAIALVVTSMLGFTACGGDDSASNPPDTVSDQTVAGQTTNPPESTTTGGNGSSDPLAGSSDECRAVALQFGAAMAQVFLPPDQRGDLDNQLQQLQGSVPAEIKDDVATVAAAIKAWSEATQADPGAAADPTQLLSDPKVTEAADRINTYFSDTCPELG